MALSQIYQAKPALQDQLAPALADAIMRLPKVSDATDLTSIVQEKLYKLHQDLMAMSDEGFQEIVGNDTEKTSEAVKSIIETMVAAIQKNKSGDSKGKS